MAIAIGRRGSRAPRGLDESARVAALLSRWRPAEVARARRVYRRLSSADVEDIYDEAVDAVRGLECESDLHLRNRLRDAIGKRALKALRDQATHERVIIERAGPRFQARERDRAAVSDPARAVLARERQIVLLEFLSALTPVKQRVFGLVAEGKKWRAIATVLHIDPNYARKLVREVERERSVFQAIYSADGLCRQRSTLIGALLAGRERRELVLTQAMAHILHCRHCQSEHGVTAAELKARFEQGALALLPPLAPHTIHLSLLDRVLLILGKPIRLFDRVTPGGTPVRDRVVEAAAATGASVKVAGTVAGVVAVVATGVTVGVHAVLPEHHHHHVRRPSAASSQPAASKATSSITASPQPLTTPAAGKHAISTSASIEHARRVARAFGPGRVVGPSRKRNTEGQHAPGGFAYLGVPHKTQSSTPSTTATVSSSSTSTTSEQSSSSSSGTEGQTRGGPFSP